MENIGHQVVDAIKNKDIGRLQSIFTQLQLKDVRKDIYDCLFESCNCKVIDSKIIDIFLKNLKVNIHQKNNKGQIVLHVLARKGHFNEIKRIIENYKPGKLKIDDKDFKWKTPFLIAAEYGHIEILKLLEHHGAATHHRDSVRNSAIHLAARNGHLLCIQYLIEETKVDVNVVNVFNDTPLMEAASHGHKDCVDYLVEHGANVNNTNYNARHALFKSAFDGYFDAVQSLIAAKSDVNVQDMTGKTPLSWAAIGGHYKVTLCLIAAKANVDHQDLEGRTPLHNAAINNHVRVINHLITAKANINIQDVQGMTPLCWAALHGQVGAVKTLIDAKANIDLSNNNDETALMIAARHGRIEVVEQLVEAGSNLELRNKQNKKAFDMTEESNIKQLLSCNLNNNIN